MKDLRFFTLTILSVAAMTVILNGCEYDVAESRWGGPPSSTVVSSITSVTPSEAVAGVNYITITGNNFEGVIDTTVVHSALTGRDTTFVYNGVYFSGVRTEIIDATSTSIKVRRPNVAADSCVVSVVPSKALGAGKYGPYKIASVVQPYGSFLDNLDLSTIAVDPLENVYVVERGSLKVYKITSNGDMTILPSLTDSTGTHAPWEPSDMKIGPDGNIYLTSVSKPRELAQIDVTTGAVSFRWRYTTLASRATAKFCDFGNNGYFYIAGVVDLFILDLSNPGSGTGINKTYPVTATGLYPNTQGYTLNGLRIYNGYVYVVVKTASTEGIWKHRIKTDGTGGLEAGTLVLDWSTTTYANPNKPLPIKNFALGTDQSTLYLQVRDTISSENLVVSSSQGLDSFYKGILPSTGFAFAWSSNTNYLYMINGNGSKEKWKVYRVDMGSKSAGR